MIRIIKHGTRTVTECENCGCKFSYEDEDILNSPPDPLHIVSSRRFIICPQCESKIVLEQTR